tara:strand:+ start:2209 stop:2625 length:417 start_codon:yes stop_codon:yes gene_type:complete
MKNILLLAILMIGFTTFSQYEDELKMLHTVCITDESNINSLFDPNVYERVPNDSLYVYEDIKKGSFYVIEYTNGLIANYIERYSNSGLKNMNNSIKKICVRPSGFYRSEFYEGDSYYYLVSNFKNKDSTIVMTVTKIN